MPHFAILRVKKLSSVQNLIGSLKHNFREIPTDNANPEKKQQNNHFKTSYRDNGIEHDILINNTQKAMKRFNDRITKIQTNGKIRSNAVLAVEYLLTASPEWWARSTPEQRKEWKRKNLNFLIQKHGLHNLIAATYQVDETTPHISAFVVPEINGKLNARHFFGGRKKLSELQTEYANEMADLGLSRGIENSKATHQTIKQYYSKINSFFKHEFKEYDKDLIREIKTRIKIPDKKMLETNHEYNEKVYNIVFKQIYSLIYSQYSELNKLNQDLAQKHDELVKLDTAKRQFQQKLIDDEVKRTTAKLTDELKKSFEVIDMLRLRLDKSEDGFYAQKVLISNLEDELSKKDRLIEQKDHQLAEQQKVFHEHQQAFENLCEQLKAAEQKLNDLKRENEPKKMDWSMDKNDPF